MSDNVVSLDAFRQKRLAEQRDRLRIFVDFYDRGFLLSPRTLFGFPVVTSHFVPEGRIVVLPAPPDKQ